MAVFNYIFIFLFLSFGSIESKTGESGQIFAPGTGKNPDHPFSPETFIPGCGIHLAEHQAGLNFMQPAVENIVLNEIMADPNPVADLPDREYVELFNQGKESVNLGNWMLELGSRQKFLPDLVIGPGDFLLVTSTGGAKELQKFGKVIEISGFMLANSGVVLSLYNPAKKLADQLTYTPLLHTKQHADGGYSLERIDPERLCGQSANWSTTLSVTGGTPGAENSIRAMNPDHVAPEILSKIFYGRSMLEIQFSENVIRPAIQEDNLKNMTPGVVVDSIRTNQNTFIMQIFFSPASVRNGMVCSLDLCGLKDECGNTMADQTLKFGYYLPVRSDLLISEVLFNPFPDGTDFVEIYNNSGHDVDLSGLFLATRDDLNAIRQVSQLSVSQQYIPHGNYVAVSKSPEGILRFYRTECEACLYKMEKFPSLADLSGDILLIDKNLEIIDEMSYDEDMHFPLITEKEGISLERISFEIPASRKDNWNSASESAGFATPGYQNSAREVADSGTRVVIAEPVVFSPNGDGVKDQLNIVLNAEFSGWILNITILNEAGRKVRVLANNVTAGSTDKIFWDGLDSEYRKVMPGIYILNVSLFHQTGKHNTTRIACVVTDRI